MLHILKAEFDLTDGHIRHLALKDVQQVYLRLKHQYSTSKNRENAVKIQSFTRMYFQRKKYRSLRAQTALSAAKITKFVRKKLAYIRFRNALTQMKVKSATLCQKVLRGYKARKMTNEKLKQKREAARQREIENLDRHKRESAQVLIAYRWQMFYADRILL